MMKAVVDAFSKWLKKCLASGFETNVFLPTNWLGKMITFFINFPLRLHFTYHLIIVLTFNADCSFTHTML